MSLPSPNTTVNLPLLHLARVLSSDAVFTNLVGLPVEEVSAVLHKLLSTQA
jgi:hypothetical protein